MAYSGLFQLTVEQLLEDVSYALVEPVVSTSLESGPVGPGVSLITPLSMAGIYLGALLLFGSGGTQEQIVVSALGSSNFTATLGFAHNAGELIFGATFPSGNPINPLFTQQEIFSYLQNVVNDFLLKTRCIFGVSGTPGDDPVIPFVVNKRFYSQPALAIRVERIARILSGQPTIDLYETTQSDMDLQDFSWSTESGDPKRWFRDQVDTAKFGLQPTPNVNGDLEFIYSKSGPVSVALNSSIGVPDPFSHYIKYGILSRCWSKDGETRDPMRSNYCKKRFEFGVVEVQKYMEEIGMDTGATPQSFSPMAVPAG